MMPRRNHDRYRRAPLDWATAEELGVQAGLVEMMTRDNAKMREAGCNLAEAAARVVRDYDGLHRLSIAISAWFGALAGEGDRDKRHAASVDTHPKDGDALAAPFTRARSRRETPQTPQHRRIHPMSKAPEPTTLLCKLFGHKWRTFDANWCGKDYQMCQRMRLHPFRICGATREIDTPGVNR